MKASPQAAWNLELTPIKHIPVKTRPEVTALLAQELPDESDEEYEPTHDEVVCYLYYKELIIIINKILYIVNSILQLE